MLPLTCQAQRLITIPVTTILSLIGRSVGCSAGAMFGALISLGHAAREAEQIATLLWTKEVARQHRWQAIPQMIMPKLRRFDADFSMRDDTLIMKRLRQAFGDWRLEDLKVPLRVAATDADAVHVCPASGRG